MAQGTQKDMGSRGGGTSWAWARVENCDDPDKAGNYQCRVLGRQDKFPVDKLTWYPLLTQGAAHQKLGVSPTWLVKGSWVRIEYSDPETMLQGTITGSVNSAGLPDKGVTIDGTTQIQKKYNTCPLPSRGGTKNDVNPYLTRKLPDSVEQGPDVSFKDPE